MHVQAIPQTHAAIRLKDYTPTFSSAEHHLALLAQARPRLHQFLLHRLVPLFRLPLLDPRPTGVLLGP